MKILVYSQDANGKVRGQINQIIEEADLAKSKNPLYLDGTLEALDLPDTIDRQYLVINDDNGVLSVGENQTFKDQLAFNAQLEQLKYDMNAELYTLMYTVAGTNDFNSATLFERTWAKMVASPSDYSSLGLTARFDRGTDISIGDALDTDAKVLSYAQACIAVAGAAEVTRMQRIEQYKADVAALYAAQ